MKNKALLTVAMAVVIGIALGAIATRVWQHETTATTASGERKILYYKNPMGTGQTSTKPIKDEMGMDYIPVYTGEEHASSNAAEPGLVTINPTVVQNIGVRTAPVKKGNVNAQVAANGIVALDETRTTTVTTKVDGYIEKLYVTSVGQIVNKGAPLFDLYSPDLAALLEEFLAALRYQQSLPATVSSAVQRNATDLVVAAHRRLELLGLSREQVARIQSERSVPRALTFYASTGGVVLKKNVLQGGYVAASTELFTLADLSEVWVLADVYAQDFAALRVGQRAQVSVQGLPGKTYAGHVDFIYPTIDAQTRTVKVRIVLPNPKRVLRPDMYASVVIQSDASTARLLVPKSAVLRTGKRDLVILALGEGKFRPQPIQIGGEGPDYYIANSGVKEGDVVVTSAQFLLEAESRINEAINKLSDDPAPQASVPAPMSTPMQKETPPGAH